MCLSQVKKKHVTTHIEIYLYVNFIGIQVNGNFNSTQLSDSFENVGFLWNLVFSRHSSQYFTIMKTFPFLKNSDILFKNSIHVDVGNSPRENRELQQSTSQFLYEPKRIRDHC